MCELHKGDGWGYELWTDWFVYEIYAWDNLFAMLDKNLLTLGGAMSLDSKALRCQSIKHRK